jgi:anti-sigma-K factor RskA
MSDERIDDLIALAALGELTDAEQRELDDLLEHDASAAHELDADLATAAALQRTYEPPPIELKARVMSAISAIAQDTPNDTPTAGNGDESGTDESAQVASLDAARTARRPRRWQTLAAAAAVVALFAGGIVALQANDADTSPTDAIEQSADAQTRALNGDLSGSLRLVYSPSAAAIVIDGVDIPALRADETYQLWFVDDAGARPIGLFRPDASGRVAQRFDELDPTDVVVAVTIEPASGSATPTLPIVAST